MGGSPEDSQKYCSKEDEKAWEHGTCPKTRTGQGQRNDIHDVVDKLRAGGSLHDLVEDTNDAVVLVKFSRGLSLVESIVAQRTGKGLPFIVWLYGTTGTGKTRTAFEFGQKVFGANNVWLSSGELKWYLGYDKQKVAIFDDFRAKSIGFSNFLRVLDRYPIHVENKGGSKFWNPEIIFITTPKSIQETFETRFIHKPEDLKQVDRRVHFKREILAEDNYLDLIEEVREEYLKFKETPK